MYRNVARPCAKMTLWLACYKKLATKDRMKKFGMVENSSCSICGRDESLDHLLYECAELKGIWCKVVG